MGYLVNCSIKDKFRTMSSPLGSRYIAVFSRFATKKSACGLRVVQVFPPNARVRTHADAILIFAPSLSHCELFKNGPTALREHS